MDREELNRGVIMNEKEALEFLQIHSLNLRCVKTPTNDDDFLETWIVERWNDMRTIRNQVGFGKTPINAISDSQQKLLKGLWR